MEQTIIQIDRKPSRWKRFWAEIKEKQEAEEIQRRRDEINGSFTVTEKDGELYIMHNGSPLARIGKHNTVGAVLDSLKKYREDAMEYYNFNNE